MAAPSHNYNTRYRLNRTRYRLNRLAAQLNEEAPQQPQEDSIKDNVHDSDVNAPGSPSKELQHNEDSNNKKKFGNRRNVTLADFLRPPPNDQHQTNTLLRTPSSSDSEDSMNDGIDKESDLSDYAFEDPAPSPCISEDDDYGYEDAKEYSKILRRSQLTCEKTTKDIKFMEKHLQAYWEGVKFLNESRKKIINELNGQLSKSRKFSNPDVTLFNSKIRSIEFDLNIGIPVISKLKATFIRDSQEQQVSYQGFKFSLARSNIYFCTYNMAPTNILFGIFGCAAHLYIDDKGFLQPRSTMRHYHGNVKEGYKVRSLVAPKCDPVKIHRLTSEGEKAGKRFKLNQFLNGKLQETDEYRKKLYEIADKKNIIDKQLGKLRALLNDDELGETDQNYLSSFIEWIKYLLQHVRIDNIH